MTPEDEIEAFWAWFAENSNHISADPDDEIVLEELDRQVSELGCPAWEIGPGDQAEWFLALSPDGDERALPLTQAIVSRAPTIPDWELLPHRPQKIWDLQFEMESGSGPMIEVDARTWSFVAYRYPDGLYDLVVSVGDEAELAPGDRERAVYLVVEGQLGEQTLLTAINEIEAVGELSPEQASRSRPLEALSPTALGGR